MNAHAIDYKIIGKKLQYEEIELDPSESVIAEAGSVLGGLGRILDGN